MVEVVIGVDGGLLGEGGGGEGTVDLKLGSLGQRRGVEGVSGGV